MKEGYTFLERMDQIRLTRSQSLIADYISKNEKRILGMTALEVGKEIGVSDASVIRFCRTMGYEGFTDMKEQIGQELKEKNKKIGKHSLHDRFVMQTEKYKTSENTMNQMVKLMGMNLETSVRQNSQESYERVITRIRNAKRKVVIGLRGGKGCAIQFYRLLSFITDHVSAITEENNDLLLKMTELDEEDLVIFLSFPRYYKIDEKLGNLMQQRKVPCILITDSMNSPLAKQAEEVLLVETEHCGFFHSMIGVTGVLEYLLILLCWSDPENFREKLKVRDAVLTEFMLEDQIKHMPENK